MNTAGTHYLCELSGCDASLLNDEAALRGALSAASAAAGTTILGSFFHRFQPQGISGLLCLAESHLAIHTWPDSGYAAIDIYTCGAQVAPEKAVAALSKSLRAGQHVTTRIVRGTPGSDGRFEHHVESSEIALAKKDCCR